MEKDGGGDPAKTARYNALRTSRHVYLGLFEHPPLRSGAVGGHWNVEILKYEFLAVTRIDTSLS